MSEPYDAIVVGGGHNGLVCAAYLARDGLRTLLVERRPAFGGMAATAEIAPGVRAPTLAHTVGRLRPRIVRELGLKEHGLALLGAEARAFAPQTDGAPGITLWSDIGRTVGELTTLAGQGVLPLRDAAAYADADRQLLALGAGLGALMGRTPPDLGHPSLADALAGVAGGLTAGTRARGEGGGLLRVLPMSVSDLVAEWFESDALRALVAARGVLLTALGPRMPGTAQVLVTDSAGHQGGVAGQSVFVRGGVGALGAALTSAAQAAGVELRSEAEVVRVLQRDDRAIGVVLASGEEIEAGVVVSGLDPKSTLLRLVDPAVLGPRLGWRASNIRAAGATAKVNLVLGALPQFSSLAGLPPDEQALRLRGRVVIAPDMRWLELAQRAAKYGQLADAPLMEATLPTLLDRTLVDEKRAGGGRHVMSVIVQAAPYELRHEDWDARRDELGDLVVATLERFAPGVGGLVEARQVITPLDIERDWGASEGHPMHAEVSLDQWFEWRPLHGYGRYRMPLAGLYLCGAGAHPGGGITGAPGLQAAHEILADVKAGRAGRSAA